MVQEALDECDAHQNQRPRNNANSRRGRKSRSYIERGREQGYERLYKDYFFDQPTYFHHKFRRRFRMSKHIFMRIVERLESGMVYFQQRADVTGRLSISALQKCTVATQMLAYGSAADIQDEYLRLSESTARICLEKFVDEIIIYFGEEYLRRPNAEDIQRLLSVGEARGFPGMLGSIDCMYWGWKNCPTAWRGTTNDIIVLDRSPVFDEVLNGRASTMNLSVNENQYKLGYYLVDGIYPSWATFVQSIRLPQGDEAHLFAKQHECYRKDVERPFGVLQSRFEIIRKPALSWDFEKLGRIMKACIILHNMIVEDERESYRYTISQSNGGVIGETTMDFPDDTYSNSRPEVLYNSRLAKRDGIRDKAIHYKLKEDLKKHIWNFQGNN